MAGPSFAGNESPEGIREEQQRQGSSELTGTDNDRPTGRHTDKSLVFS